MLHSMTYETGQSTEHCIACFLAEVKHMGEEQVSFTCLQGNEGPHFQCSAHSGAFQWVARVPSVNIELFYQSVFLRLGCLNDNIRRTPPPQEKLQPADRLIAPAVSGYLTLHVTYIYTQRPDNQDTPHRDCCLTLMPGSCFRYLYVWCSCDTDVTVPEKKKKMQFQMEVYM